MRPTVSLSEPHWIPIEMGDVGETHTEHRAFDLRYTLSSLAHAIKTSTTIDTQGVLYTSSLIGKGCIQAALLVQGVY